MHEMCRSEGGRRGSRGASPREGGRAQNWALGRPLTLGLVNDPPHLAGGAGTPKSSFYG